MRRRVALVAAALAAIGIAAAMAVFRPFAPRATRIEATPGTAVGANLVEVDAAAGLRPAESRVTQPTRGAIRVTVTAQERPCAGVTVRLRAVGRASPKAVRATDADGRATFDDAAAGDLLEALAEGLRQVDGPEEVGPALGEILLELTEGVPFDGRVLDMRTGGPIAGASVAVRDGFHVLEVEVGPTDASGRFHVPGVMNDSVAHVVVRAAGYAASRESKPIGDGQPSPPSELILELEPAGTIFGVVRSPDGDPVADATVLAVPKRNPVAGADTGPEEVEETLARFAREAIGEEDVEDPDVLTAVTGADGTYRLIGLTAEQSYTVTARAAGYADASPQRGLILGAGAEMRVPLDLVRPATVVVRVLVPAGTALPDDARVRIYRPDPRRAAEKPGPPGRDGRFSFTGLDAGPADLCVAAKGFRSALEALTLRTGETIEVEVTLERDAVHDEAIEGIVVDASGKPIEGATVGGAPARFNEVEYGDRLLEERRVTSDAEGRFTLSRLPAGPAFVVARSEDEEGRIHLGTRRRVPVIAPAKGVRLMIAPLGSVRMRLRTPEGSPFTGEAWVMTTRGGAGTGSPRTLPDGIVEVLGLFDGEVTLEVSPRGYAGFERDVTIRDGSAVDLGDVALDPGVRLTGRVIDGSGRPVPNAGVRSGSFHGPTAETDEEGRFSLEAVERTGAVVVATCEGYSQAQLDVSSGKIDALELRIQKSAAISGTVRLPHGAPGPRGTIELRRPAAAHPRESVEPLGEADDDVEVFVESGDLTVDEGGVLKETQVPPGRWIGHWRDRRGVEHVVGDWTFEEGKPHFLEIVLPGR